MRFKHIFDEKLYFFIIFFLIFLSCNKTRDSVSLHEKSPEKLKKEIISSGNVESYKLLSMYYGDKKMDEDFLGLSIMMYEKNNCIDALSNIYYAYIYKYNPNVPFFSGNETELFKNVPKKEQEIALKYLEIGYSKGDYPCMEALSDYYLSIGENNKSEQIIKKLDDLIIEHRKKVNDTLMGRNK